jgi:nucleolar complex protein 2
MAQSKSTKKFEKHHLKDVLKRRKEVGKIKQRKHMQEKKKEARSAEEQNGETTNGDTAKAATTEGERLKNMSVDDFFQGGFEIPEKPRSKRKRTKAKPDLKTKKRQKKDDDSQASSDEDEALGGGVIDAEGHVGSDSEQDTGDHKEQLAALAEKDPEFYKFLKENDADLLNFEDDDLAGLAELIDEEASSKRSRKGAPIESDEDEEEDAEQDSRNEITLARISNWKKTISNQKSFRATRELVLAFRAAVRLNDEKGKDYKYTITDPEAYNELLKAALKYVPEVLQHHLPIKESASGKM